PTPLSLHLFSYSLAPCRVLHFSLHDALPISPDGLTPELCYRGEDTWMGPFCGREAHNGLDINHPAGTRLWAPISFDEHEMFNSRSEEHTSELQSRFDLVCRLLLEKKNVTTPT